MVKIAFDAGHGINTAGKRSPDNEREWSFNNTVAVAFENELKKYKGISLLRTDDRTGKYDVPLRDRTNRANRWGADVYVSFHHNALRHDKWGNHTGVETFYYKGSSEGKKLATLVQKAMVEAYQLRDRGIKTNNLHITRETKCVAVLTEGGFMDSTIDIKKLRDKKVLEKAGKLVAQAVAEYLGLSKDKASSSKTTPKQSAPKSTPKKSASKPATSDVKVGSKVTLSTSASKYATGQNIPSRYKGKSYTVQQVKSDRVLLKEIISWVYMKDLKDVKSVSNSVSKTTQKTSSPKETSTTSTNKSSSNISIKVGSKVEIKSNASKYATGQTIPSRYKGKTYTVMQVKSDMVLLKELYSWVYKKDVTVRGGNSSSSKPKSNNSGIKVVGQIRLNKIKNFTYIYDKPDSSSKRIGTAKVNSTFNIAGSVPNWYEVIYKGRRAYINAKYASRIK